MDDDFDEEELNKLYESLQAEEQAQDAGVPTPRLRATYRNARLLLTPHSDILAGDGPVLTMVAENGDRNVVIANLSEAEDERDGHSSWELTVTPLTDGGLTAASERALLAWAEHVGYRRAWLPDRVVDLGARPHSRSIAEVRCDSCGQFWRHSGWDFWTNVAERRSFPTFCLLCGGDLPAWRVRRIARRRRSVPPR